MFWSVLDCIIYSNYASLFTSLRVSYLVYDSSIGVVSMRSHTPCAPMKKVMFWFVLDCVMYSNYATLFPCFVYTVLCELPGVWQRYWRSEYALTRSLCTHEKGDVLVCSRLCHVLKLCDTISVFRLHRFVWVTWCMTAVLAFWVCAHMLLGRPWRRWCSDPSWSALVTQCRSSQPDPSALEGYSWACEKCRAVCPAHEAVVLPAQYKKFTCEWCVATLLWENNADCR